MSNIALGAAAGSIGALLGEQLFREIVPRRKEGKKKKKKKVVDDEQRLIVQDSMVDLIDEWTVGFLTPGQSGTGHNYVLAGTYERWYWIANLGRYNHNMGVFGRCRLVLMPFVSGDGGGYNVSFYSNLARQTNGSIGSLMTKIVDMNVHQTGAQGAYQRTAIALPANKCYEVHLRTVYVCMYDTENQNWYHLHTGVLQFSQAQWDDFVAGKYVDLRKANYGLGSDASMAIYARWRPDHVVTNVAYEMTYTTIVDPRTSVILPFVAALDESGDFTTTRVKAIVPTMIIKEIAF
jgi:hypothetical protein